MHPIPPVLADETRRLERLRALSLLDSEPEPLFDAIVHQAGELCGTGIALISLLDERRQWFKAQVGLPGWSEVPRASAFCAYTIAGGRSLEVADARLDARFAANPLVVGTPNVRFYAGLPLCLSGGERVGTLCVMDSRPRRLDAAQIRALSGLAEIASHALEQRSVLSRQAGVLRSRFEQDLREAESRYRVIAEEQSEMVSLAQADGTLIYVEAAVQHGMATGEPWDLELPLTTAKGRRIWVRAMGEVEFENGRAVRLLGAFQDITERRRLEQQVADDERFLRQLADSLPLRIAYLDRERSEVIGRTRAELWPTDDDAPFSARAHAALAGQAQQFEFDETVAGQLRRFENRLIPDRTESGEVRGFFVTGIDITERNAAERALRELTTIFDNTTDFVLQADRSGQIIYMNPSARRAFGLQPDEPLAQGRIEHYASVMRDISVAVLAKQEVLRQADILRSVTEAIPATVVVVGSDGRYRFVNGAFERYCGLPRERILGRSAREVLGDAEIDRRSPWVRRALAGEAVNFTLDYPARDGTTYLALSRIPLRLESGEVDGFVGVAQDITQQKREEDRLLQLAQRDPLTGLLNRTGFERGLELLLRPEQTGRRAAARGQGGRQGAAASRHGLKRTRTHSSIPVQPDTRRTHAVPTPRPKPAQSLCAVPRHDDVCRPDRHHRSAPDRGRRASERHQLHRHRRRLLHRPIRDDGR